MVLANPNYALCPHAGGDWGTVSADGNVQLPPALPLTSMCFSESGAYLLNNGRNMMLWLGRMLDPAWSLEVGVCLGSACPRRG